eukprot:1106245-Prorocentrum_minimum.AAC.3
MIENAANKNFNKHDNKQSRRLRGRPLCPLFAHSKTQTLPKMGHAAVWNSHPKQYGQAGNPCRVCNNTHGLIRKYGLNMCRQCFRQYSKDIGFHKLR